MGKQIKGIFKDVTFSPSHMAYVIDDGEGPQHVVVDNDTPDRWKQHKMEEGAIKWMISIPDNCEVTIVGSPDGQNTMRTQLRGHELIVKVVAAEALVWNSSNRHWYVDNDVETVMRMVNFEGVRRSILASEPFNSSALERETQQYL